MPGESETAIQAAAQREQTQRQLEHRRLFWYGLATPVAYALVALTVIDLLTSRASGLQAVRHLDALVWIALIAYAGLVLLIHKVLNRPGFLAGVLWATLPILAIIAWLSTRVSEAG
jgi:hypothetical protein